MNIRRVIVTIQISIDDDTETEETAKYIIDTALDGYVAEWRLATTRLLP